ncbi:proteasome subunit alpha [Nitrospina watsonii]|uniref:Proteasome, alpha subunit n=1 Tax=Nitrospina watsonii TaxID=1323948 RepID=A0ABN8W0Y2_9BACT|nr:proteasome subunit alpha [Nitrospina watsonii]CAI2719660.1 Putative Proteasome, alpha subunit [Nitrospina watsonii]
MFEEPFRWMEAMSTRHSYVQEKLRKGQPVVAVPFSEGALMMGFTIQPGKIFEVYDRIALGSLGHPADVERLRMTLLDMAHLEGFNRSEKDVTIARLLQFGVAPALKQNFEEVMRAPYLVKLLLMEMNFEDKPLFFRLNYDGHWEMFKKGTVIAGNDKEAEFMEKEIGKRDFASLPLEQAMVEVSRMWEESKKQAASEADSEKETTLTLAEVFENWTLEAAVLTTTRKKSLFRWVTSGELETLKKTCV